MMVTFETEALAVRGSGSTIPIASTPTSTVEASPTQMPNRGRNPTNLLPLVMARDDPRLLPASDNR